MESLGDSTPLGRVKTPVWAESGTVEFGGRWAGGVRPDCKHEGIRLWDSSGHNFLVVVGYHHPDELQIIIDLINNYAPIVYAARDLLESEKYVKGGDATLDKLLTRLEEAVNGKPNMEETDAEEEQEEYTLDEIQFDL